MNYLSHITVVKTAMLVGLSHPNVLALFGTTRDNDGSLYQILEFCDGGDLAVRVCIYIDVEIRSCPP